MATEDAARFLESIRTMTTEDWERLEVPTPRRLVPRALGLERGSLSLLYLHRLLWLATASPLGRNALYAESLPDAMLVGREAESIARAAGAPAHAAQSARLLGTALELVARIRQARPEWSGLAYTGLHRLALGVSLNSPRTPAPV